MIKLRKREKEKIGKIRIYSSENIIYDKKAKFLVYII